MPIEETDDLGDGSEDGIYTCSQSYGSDAISERSLPGYESEAETAEHTIELLRHDSDNNNNDGDVEDDDTTSTKIPHPSKALYISHTISTWNSRGFEFGAILFLATIYPGTLLQISIYALVRALAAIVFSPWVGRYIDRGDRLEVVRWAILGQRGSVVCSCGLFLLLISIAASLSGLSFEGPVGGLDGVGGIDVDYTHDGDDQKKFWLLILKHVSFVGVVLLACVEKLCSIMNTVCIERDWVVVIAGDREDCLQEMNSQLRRIDLFCKLISPLAIALLDGLSSRIAVLTTLGVNAGFIGVEYFLIARVYRLTPALAKQGPVSVSSAMDSDISLASLEGNTSSNTTSLPAQRRSAMMSIVSDLRTYFNSPAVLPSLSLSILYLTVLSFSGQMTTYLLAVPSPRLDSMSVGLLRTVSTIFELSSTFIAPRLISSIGAVRAGIWCLSWQALCLISGVGILFGTKTGPFPNLFVRDDVSNITDSQTGVIALVVGVMLSRIGLWSFDLVAQLLIQNSIDSTQRGSFSSVEASLQNFFELCAFATTIVWSKPEQFKYPALISTIAVLVAGACYASFVRSRRGHLIHFPPCLDLPWTSRLKGSSRRRSYAALMEEDGIEDIGMVDRGTSA